MLLLNLKLRVLMDKDGRFISSCLLEYDINVCLSGIEGVLRLEEHTLLWVSEGYLGW